MIRINLLGSKKPLMATTVAGVDLSKINFKLIVLAIGFSYMPEFLFKEQWESDRNKMRDTIREKNKEISGLNKKLRDNKDIQERLLAYNEQVEKLKERSKQVQEIILKKTNPRSALEVLARGTPKDLWFNSLAVENGKTVIVKGGSLSYESIGSFMGEVNETKFFKKSLNLVNSSTAELPILGDTYRVEQFEIKGQIFTFE